MPSNPVRKLYQCHQQLWLKRNAPRCLAEFTERPSSVSLADQCVNANARTQQHDCDKHNTLVILRGRIRRGMDPLAALHTLMRGDNSARAVAQGTETHVD